MRQRRSISARVFGSIETSLLILFLLLIVIVLADAVTRPMPGHGFYQNLPHSLHTVPMSGANREDALLVVIMQDGKIYFGSEQAHVDTLPASILDRLEDRDVERKVYLRVDKRARYRIVKKVLDGIRETGVERIGFLADPL